MKMKEKKYLVGGIVLLGIVSLLVGALYIWKRQENPKTQTYTVEVSLEGGSGRASITSPTQVTITNGKAEALIQWSSPYYDYMIVGNDQYQPVQKEGNAQFQIPIQWDKPMSVIADTTAMSQPHEISYTLTFYKDTLQKQTGNKNRGKASTNQKEASVTATPNQKEIHLDISKELTYEGKEPLDFAKEFRIDRYANGYRLLTIGQDRAYLIVPENQPVPKDLPTDLCVLQRPISHIYLAASATMDMFIKMDGLSAIGYVGTKKEDWTLEEARSEMDAGRLVFAGNYQAPDYELLLSKGCDLAIENTMIYHAPKTKEALEARKIPVLVDYASYESHIMGRCEWIKFYGAMLGKEKEAKSAYEKQKKIWESIPISHGTKPKVAFFYISGNGMVHVRTATDYIPNMITLAGGSYAFADLQGKEGTKAASVTLSMEEFYAVAKEADVLVYNGTIQGEMESKAALLEKFPLLANSKAVKEGQVYGTKKNMYQSSMEVGTMIAEFHQMLCKQNTDLQYLYLLE